MGIFGWLFGGEKGHKKQKKCATIKASRRQVPGGIYHGGKINPLVAFSAAEVYLKKVTGKNLTAVQKILLVKLLPCPSELNIDANSNFSDSYVLDLLMVISKWTLGESFRGRMLMNSRKERQEYLSRKGHHYALLKAAGIEPVDVLHLFESEKIRSITELSDSPDKVTLCNVNTYRHLVRHWHENPRLREAMTKPAIQTINQKELLLQFIDE